MGLGRVVEDGAHEVQRHAARRDGIDFTVFKALGKRVFALTEGQPSALPLEVPGMQQHRAGAGAPHGLPNELNHVLKKVLARDKQRPVVFHMGEQGVDDVAAMRLRVCPVDVKDGFRVVGERQAQSVDRLGPTAAVEPLLHLQVFADHAREHHLQLAVW